MHATLHDHPSHETLTAYGAGKLDDEQTAVIESHLEECESCALVVSELPDNSIIEVLREAQAESDKDTAVTAADVRQPTKVPAAYQATLPPDGVTDAEEGRPSRGDEVPPELAGHPRYEILERLGEGGMGRVFKARHKIMNRIVALKLVSSKLVSNPQAIERFRREVHAAASLSHPNIVTAHDAEQAGDLHFLAMEFVDGQDLEQMVKDHGPLSVDQACEYIRQAADGLQQAHEAKMVHRDIKPHNLMVGADGKIKILDFGLASLTAEILDEDLMEEADGDSASQSPRLTVSGTMMGTPDYISPEQGQDATSADIRSDIYGLGCTMYYLLAGKPPFDEGSVLDKLRAHVGEDAQPLEELRDDVPPVVAEVVRKMMAKRPEDRYQTPAEVAEALRRAGDVGPLMAVDASAKIEPKAVGKHIQPAYTGRSPRWLIATAIGALFLLIALGAVITIATDRGVLEIRSEVGDVQVAIMKDGQQVEVIDAATGSKIRWLATDEYQLKLIGDDNDVKLDKSGFTMSRLGRVIVTARWRDDECGRRSPLRARCGNHHPGRRRKLRAQSMAAGRSPPTRPVPCGCLKCRCPK